MPNSTAIYSNGKVYTYRQISSYADQVSLMLDKSRTRSDRVGIAVKSKVGFVVSLVGTIRTGRSAVILNTGLPRDAIRVNVRDTKAKILVYDHENSKIAALVKGRATSVMVEKAFSVGGRRTSTYTLIRRQVQPETEWGVLFSSGTTGIPKGIERDHYSIVTENLGWCLELGLNRATTFYIGRPVFYTGGLVLTLSTFLSGGATVLNDYIDYNNPKEVWTDFQRTLKSIRIDWGFFVPDQIRTFLKLEGNGRRKALSCGTILTMGAPISGDEKVAVVKNLRSKIVESWGNSESLGTITDPEDVVIRPKSIGRPFVTDELMIIDENLNICNPNKIGRIAGGTEAGFLRYSNRPMETQRARKNDLIISEDMGFVDEAGYFYVVGRMQDMVLRGSATIFLSVIESKLSKAFPGQGILVVALGEDNSKVKLLAVESRGHIKGTPIKPQDVNAALAQEEKIDDILVIDNVPLLPSGKVDRVRLKQLAARLADG